MVDAGDTVVREALTTLGRWAAPQLRGSLKPRSVLGGDPVGDLVDHVFLPGLGLRVGVGRVAVDGEAVLGAVDLLQP